MDTALEARLDDFIRCSICMEYFSSPQSLCCGHVFCTSCCTKLTVDESLMCPICRTVSELKDLRTDYHTLSLVDNYISTISSDGQPKAKTVTHSSTQVNVQNLTSNNHPNSNRTPNTWRSFIYIILSTLFRMFLTYLKFVCYVFLAHIIVFLLVFCFLMLKFYVTEHICPYIHNNSLAVNTIKENTKELELEIKKEMAYLKSKKTEQLKALKLKSRKAARDLQKLESEFNAQLAIHHKGLWNQLFSEGERYKVLIRDQYRMTEKELKTALKNQDVERMSSVLQEIRTAHQYGIFNLSEGYRLNFTKASPYAINPLTQQCLVNVRPNHIKKSPTGIQDVPCELLALLTRSRWTMPYISLICNPVMMYYVCQGVLAQGQEIHWETYVLHWLCLGWSMDALHEHLNDINVCT